MQRDRLLIEEMIDAAEQAVSLVGNADVETIEADRQRRDALLWNFTVLGEAAAQVTGELKRAHPDLAWTLPSRLRNRIVHGYWSVDTEILQSTALDQLPTFVIQLRKILDGLTSS